MSPRPTRVLSAVASISVLISFAWIAVPIGSLSAEAATAPQLSRYPYLTDLAGPHASINFATDTSGTTASVQYGTSPNCNTTTVGATKTTITVGSTSEYQWKAMLSGLSADTEYCYRVYLGATNLLGNDPSPTFRSQLAAGSTTPFSFAVFGDWGEVDSTGTNVDQANLMRQVSLSGARFAVTTGDTAYPGGSQTNYGDLLQSGADTSAIFGPSFWTVAGASTPLFNVTGNHGFSNSVGLVNWPQDRAASSSAGRYQMDTYCCTNGTNSASYASAWYAFDAGNARFYVLTSAWANSNVGSADLYKNDYDNHWTTSSPEYQWLQQDLQNHPTALKFAFWHFPMYSDNPNETSDTYLRGASSLEGLLATYGVNVGFSGHAHLYQRNTKPAGGIVTYITGGGGARLEPIGPCSSIDAYGIGWSYSSSTHGSACGAAQRPTAISQVFNFLRVSVNGTTVTVTPTDSAGNTFDVVTYHFSGGGADTESPTAPSDLVAAAASPNRVDLTWTAATDNVGVTAYDIYRGGSLLTSISNVTSFADTTAAPSTTYTYTVRARDAAGNTSPASNAASVTTPALPSTLTFSPTDDTYIQANTPNKTAGSATTLQVSNGPIKQILIKFDVTGLAGRYVTSAKLRLHNTDGSAKGGDFFRTVSSTWSQSTATWNNAPDVTGSVIASLGDVAIGNWYDVDLASIVSGDGVVSLRVASTSTDAAKYVSSEGTAGFRPQLVVTYDDVPPPPPPAPTGLSATGGDGQVGLSWNPSAGATSYKLKRATSTGGPYTTVLTPSGTSATDTTVTNGTTYYYVVTAVNAGGESPNSAEVSAAPKPAAPAAPTGMSAIAGDGQVSLTWNASTGATSYTVKRGTSASSYDTTIPVGAATSHIDTGLTNGTTYYYVVTASNTAGTSPNSAEVSATPTAPQAPPDAPTGLTATPGNSQVSLSWNASAEATSYTLKRSTTPGSGYTAVRSGITATSATDTGLSNGTTYYYVVTAVNSSGESGNSNEASATPVAQTRTFVFSDGFETGDLSKWTSNGGLTVEGSLKHTGTWAAQGNTTNGTTYAKKLLSTSYTNGYFRIWFYLASGYTSQVNVLRYRTAADSSLGYLFVSTTGKLSLRNDVGLVTTTSATTVSSNGWHALELHLVVNGASSSTEVWLDDVKISVLSLTTQEWGATGIGKLQVGEVQSGRTYNVAFDDVAFDAAPIGLAPIP